MAKPKKFLGRYYVHTSENTKEGRNITFNSFFYYKSGHEIIFRRFKMVYISNPFFYMGVTTSVGCFVAVDIL